MAQLGERLYKCNNICCFEIAAIKRAASARCRVCLLLVNASGHTFTRIRGYDGESVTTTVSQ